MAAIRETFEETGLLVGRRAGDIPRIRCGSWAAFVSRGVAPVLDILDLVARAVTPPPSHMRFDTRFFMADAEHIQGSPKGEFSGSGELLKVQWVPLARAQALDLPAITRFVITQVQKRLESPASQDQGFPVPFLRFRRGKAILEYL
jgi:8-oxo-dGTP pyrophosphatase MutT (NUDIX family)